MGRPATPRRYAKATVQEITYRPVHDELFKLAASDWVRPRKVKVRTSKTGWTLEARFTSPDGTPVALRTRARKYADGKVFITEQSMAFRFSVPSVGAVR